MWSLVPCRSVDCSVQVSYLDVLLHGDRLSICVTKAKNKKMVNASVQIKMLEMYAAWAKNMQFG